MIEPSTPFHYPDDEAEEPADMFDRAGRLAAMRSLLQLFLEPRTAKARNTRLEIARWLFEDRTRTSETPRELYTRLGITRRRMEQIIREVRHFAVSKSN